MASPAYKGDELALFQHATRWKEYVRDQLRPYLSGRVLEVGAGLGATTVPFLSPAVTSWTCLEPDPAMVEGLRARFADSRRVQVIGGTTESVGEPQGFDTVLYIDVLEHIEDDRAELERAARLLSPGGAIVVLSPAHQWLFTPFDERIGHHRRYSMGTLRAAAPASLQLERTWYLDAAGLLASLGNRLLLSQSMPTQSQVLFWDRRLVPVSRWLDPLLGYRVGKSVVAVWRRR